jgi:hypothetical protein
MAPRKLGKWFQAPRAEYEIQPLHQDRVHLDPLGESQLAQLVVNGWRSLNNRPFSYSSQPQGTASQASP